MTEVWNSFVAVNKVPSMKLSMGKLEYRSACCTSRKRNTNCLGEGQKFVNDLRADCLY